jgi:demethylmenaquinone methyltransferase/2-methoxy-6-polyprenyl-1,4-benzoquinol methylase
MDLKKSNHLHFAFRPSILSIFTSLFLEMDNKNTGQNVDNKAVVGAMFDSIAWRYDFLNHFLSFGIDRLWRKKAIKIISEAAQNPRILDVATGTGDLAIAAMSLDPEKVTGIDISQKMLEIGREKIKEKGLSEKIELLTGDSESISFPDNSFDVAMVAFGVRNFSNPAKGLTEMKRVLTPGGLIMVLEFSKPTSFPFRQIYIFYFLNILPFFGRIFSKDKEAYRYLPETVMKFPDNEKFIKLMSDAGYTEIKQTKLTFGVASIYTGIK